MFTNWLHIHLKLLIALFQYCTAHTNLPATNDGYIKTEENFVVMWYCNEIVGTLPPGKLLLQNHRLVTMTTGEQVKLLHSNIA